MRRPKAEQPVRDHFFLRTGIIRNREQDELDKASSAALHNPKCRRHSFCSQPVDPDLLEAVDAQQNPFGIATVPAPIPEPAAWLIALVGAGGLMAVRRRVVVCRDG